MDWKRHTAGAQEAVGHNAETRAQRMDWKRHTARAQEAVGHNAETEHRENGLEETYSRCTRGSRTQC